MEIEDLIQPISEEAPSGVDFDDDHQLSYEAGNLESMVEGEIDPKDGQRLKPKWQQIQKKGLELSKRGKNLRVAAILTEGGCVTEGFFGLRDGLRLIREWTERYWDSLHPIYDRQPLLQSLNREQVLMKAILGAVYAPKDPGDDFDFGEFLSGWEGPGEEPTDSRLSRLATAMFSKLSPEKRGANLVAIDEALEHAKAIENCFDNRYGTDDSIDLSEMRTMLARSMQIIESYSSGAEAEDPGSEEHPVAAESGGPVVAASRPGAMTRTSAIAMLDQVIRFFETTEPSSPVPFLLNRAKFCIGKNFMELIDELAVTKDQAELILKPSATSE
ncbi:type VI secretion system ImpA family N-terminal domain-containing protein [Prosthecobacter sp. SYSU 5D2]|uniref:type VI secretion system protein TssA n=1 Tax=Prosthecobacter sp. SYSU 5D2 TaxID=3134134 RepID=UPI0031FF254B